MKCPRALLSGSAAGLLILLAGCASLATRSAEPSSSTAARLDLASEPAAACACHEQGCVVVVTPGAVADPGRSPTRRGHCGAACAGPAPEAGLGPAHAQPRALPARDHAACRDGEPTRVCADVRVEDRHGRGAARPNRNRPRCPDRDATGGPAGNPRNDLVRVGAGPVELEGGRERPLARAVRAHRPHVLCCVQTREPGAQEDDALAVGRPRRRGRRLAPFALRQPAVVRPVGVDDVDLGRIARRHQEPLAVGRPGGRAVQGLASSHER